MKSDEEDATENIHIIDMDEDEIETDTWYITFAKRTVDMCAIGGKMVTWKTRIN